MLIKVWEKYRIKKEYKPHIAEGLFMGYNITKKKAIKLVQKIWIMDELPKIEIVDKKNTMISFSTDGYSLGITLDEVTKIEEKPKPDKNQLKII